MPRIQFGEWERGGEDEDEDINECLSQILSPLFYPA